MVSLALVALTPLVRFKASLEFSFSSLLPVLVIDNCGIHLLSDPWFKRVFEVVEASHHLILNSGHSRVNFWVISGSSFDLIRSALGSIFPSISGTW
ncbi:hypothetical protein EDB82DRAFT_275618 [Fusarium venenatum]|uniref:uncharacterized protein n=1 Tax=Fusarium venenatum TaxID=56646 RepID=UPI001DD8FC35|nr:hypothetical protein EDB82DRAFT_275618 [Fusarium venenatum]